MTNPLALKYFSFNYSHYWQFEKKLPATVTMLQQRFAAKSKATIGCETRNQLGEILAQYI